MASYNSQDVNQQGQYPGLMGARIGVGAPPEGTGAPGSPARAGGRADDTTQPGQYPAAAPFGGTPLDGTGAPGTQGIPPESQHAGPDSVTFTKPSEGIKASRDEEPGLPTETYSASVSGTGDWTTPNAQSYGGAPQYQMPGITVLPRAGDGPFQPGGGTIRRGRVGGGGAGGG
jgi:hypothetical protein